MSRHARSSRCWAAVALLTFAGSCTDVLSPSRLHPGAGHKVIDVTVATVALDITYNGQTIGPSMGAPPVASTVQGDRCFYLVIDGSRNFQSACGSMDVLNLPPGQHTIELQDQVSTPGSPVFTYVDVESPVSVILSGGVSTPVSFDIASVRGEVDGVVQINGQAPPDNQYSACPDTGGCGQLFGGAFKLFVRPGSGLLHVRTMMGNSIVDIPYSATLGVTTDLGTTNVEFGSVALDLIYNGASIGPSMGAPPTASSVQGDRCFYLTIDSSPSPQSVCGSMTVANLSAGTHTFLLRDQVPTPGSPMFTYVDVQPQTSVTVVANQTTPLTFDISGTRGKVTGIVHVNGQAPPDNQYTACPDMGGCSQLFGGAFNLFAHVGSGTVHVRSMQPGGGSIADLTYTVAPAATTDLGTTDVQLGSVAIDVTYNGATIGPSIGAPPGASTVQGDKCFQLTIDGSANVQSVCGSMTLANVIPGTHTLLLRDQVPTPGSPMFSYVDVQPATTITVVAGQSTPVNFDISGVRGEITGLVHINGQAPPDYQYNICLDAGSCGQLFSGVFTLFARVGSGKASLRSMMGFNSLAEFTFIVAAGNTTIIGGLSTAPPGSTPAGTSVDVLPINQSDGTSNTTVTMNFSDVTTAGTTTVLQSATGAPPPTGLQLGTPPLYFDLSTTATFSGPVQVCINYTGTTFPDGTTLALLHGDGAGNWTDVTTSVDPVNRIICGSVTSFSPFVVASRTSAQAPTITPTATGTAGADGWYTSNVSLTWTVSANGGTLSNESGCGSTTVTSNTTGETFTCSATNAGGTTTQSITIKRDATPPVVTPTVTGPQGDNGWYVGDVAISWASSDETSGITSGACASSTLASDNAGTTYSCSTTNGAGLSTTGQVTVKRDATKPVVQYSGNAGAYTVDQTVAISCSAADAMSGVASTTCQNVNAGAYTLPLGTNTLSASAVDRAGNEGLGTTAFTVSVTTTSLCNLTRRWTSTPHVAISLCAKLDAAAASRARGNANAAQNQIGAYINEVRAQSGKNISADSAAILSRLAGSL